MKQAGIEVEVFPVMLESKCMGAGRLMGQREKEEGCVLSIFTRNKPAIFTHSRPANLTVGE